MTTTIPALGSPSRASTSPIRAANGRAVPAASFLQKPFTPAALAAKVRSVLDAKVQKRGGAAQ